ncbi:PspC domain-containing protein [Spongiimicrobium sp. 2-473A-2-J]|uniref:PspC domain-containing protein n=1 Tax=Eudoraea algarum TaxID=3417568 RepID=UPI003D36F472
MNKTVNINLANTIFHIDEEAYNKLRRYLEAIKRSFAGTPGSDEILSDIEARISELFYEKMENDRQVITQKEVDEVVAIMGQPEDYMIDEDIFEDEPKPKAKASGRVKKLYRDIDSKYIGGVCSGLEHYLGLDALWIRLIFIFLAVFTGFGFIAYILLWILVPEAATTSQKLDMTGEAVNISNIERKVKEGFDDVADKVKNVDYGEMGKKVKSSGRTFFDTIGDIIMFLFKVAGKFIGILLIIIGAATLIGLFVGLFTVGILDIVHIPGVDFYDMVNSTEAPVWLVSLLTFLAIGIPFFFLLYLGLKILVTNLKSIGNIAKFSLLGLWLIALIGIIILGVKQASAHAYTGSISERQELHFDTVVDTMEIKMRSNELYEIQDNIGINGMAVTYNEAGDRLLISDDILFDIKKAEDSVASVKIRKDANGSSFNEARERAGNIQYGFALAGNAIVMDDFITTDIANKVRDQEVRATLYIPEGQVIKFDTGVKGHIGRSTKNDQNLYRSRITDYIWVMGKDGELKCQDCPEGLRGDDSDSGRGRIIINEDGVDINLNDEQDSFEMKIDEDGVKIKAKENN